MAKFTPSNSLETLLTQDLLLRLAGDRSFHRGENYFQLGYVNDFEIGADTLSAWVTGGEDYYVICGLRESSFRLAVLAHWKRIRFFVSIV